MNLDEKDVPAAIDDLAGLLLERGFEQTATTTGGMGGYHTILRGTSQGGAGRSVEVQFLAELGQWSIGLRFGGMKRFVAPAVWARYLYGDGIRDGDIVREAQFVAQHIDDAAGAVERDPHLQDALNDIGMALMQERKDMQAE